jgi:hypothetical protein
MALTKITNSLVAVNAIQGTLIADNAITAVHIQQNQVNTTQIAINAVTATIIQDGVIARAHLAADLVDSTKIADDAISEEHLDVTVISSLSEVTANSSDYVMIGDASDSNNLKKVLVSDLQQTDEEIADIVGAMVSSNTESGITVAYEDGDNTLDFTVGTLNQNTTGTAATVTTAAQPAITSVGTLSSLTLGGDLTMGSNQIIFNNNSQAIQIKDAAGTASYVLYQDNADTLILGNGTNVEKIRLDTGGNEGALVIDTDGNIGIGNTSPSYQLDISGDSRVRVTGTNASNFGAYEAENNAGVGAFFGMGGNGRSDLLDNRGYVNTQTASDGLVISNEGADPIIFAVGGLATSDEVMRIHSDGNVGIGETSPDAPLHITSATPIIVFDESDASQEYRIGSFGGAFAIYDATDSAYRMIVDGNGNIFKGHTSSVAQEVCQSGTTVSSWTPGVQINGSGNGGLSVSQWNTGNTASANLWLTKSSNGTVGTHGGLSQNEAIGRIIFSASDGSTFSNVASIEAFADDGMGSNDTPGRIELKTTADGATTPTSRMTINNDGKVGIGTTSPAEKLFIENTTDSTDVAITVKNTGSAGGEDAMINLYAHASGGDPAIRWHITGTESWTMGLDNSDSDKLMISNGSSLPGTNYMTFTGGKVGIGTTSPLSHLTFESDHWNTGTEDGPSIRWNNGITTADSVIQNFEDANVAPFLIGMNSYINSSGTYAPFNSSYASSFLYQAASGNILFGNNSSGTPTTRMTIAANGNLTYDSLSYDAAADQMTINNGLFLSSGYIRSGAADFSLGTASNGVMFTLDDSANRIGFGTSTPDVKFDFEGNSASTYECYIKNTNSSYTGYAKVLNVGSYTGGSVNWSPFQTLSGNGSGFSDIEHHLRGDGNGYCDGSWNGGGADYAEYFEWKDGNPSDEERRGFSVVLDGDKVVKATSSTTDIIGVVSSNPSMVGNSDMEAWKQKYLRDDYGGYDWGEDGYRKPNPAYDDSLTYVRREFRKEWGIIGLMGRCRLTKGEPTNPNWIKLRDISATVEEWLVR